mgnify:CR=1 FL=1
MKQSVCYTHFHSNKVFRGDLQAVPKAPYYPKGGMISYASSFAIGVRGRIHRHRS